MAGFGSSYAAESTKLSAARSAAKDVTASYSTQPTPPTPLPTQDYHTQGHTMRWLVMLSVSSLSLAGVVLPTLPPTPIPATRAPPTIAPLPGCEQTSSPLNASFLPERAYQFLKCWTFQCTGTAHMTFLNISSYGKVSLVNSNGYELTALKEHDSYTASYPANGEMMILFNASNTNSYYNTIDFTVEWECDADTPVVPPDSSEYHTLAQNGTYKLLYSKRGDHTWIIPCTGTLSIAEQVGNLNYANLIYNNSNGSTVFSQYSSPYDPSHSSSNEYQVDGNFLIQLSSYYTTSSDNFFSLSWSCDSVSGQPLTKSPVYSICSNDISTLHANHNTRPSFSSSVRPTDTYRSTISTNRPACCLDICTYRHACWFYFCTTDICTCYTTSNSTNSNTIRPACWRHFCTTTTSFCERSVHN